MTSRSGGPRTSSRRRWWPSCSPRSRAGCAGCPRSPTSRSSAACWSCTACSSTPPTATASCARPDQRRAGAHRRHRHPRRFLPGAGAALRPAAAPARRGVHPRPRRLPHRRAPDQLPPRRAARVRRRDREAPGRPAADRAATACTAPTCSCRTRASVRPSRCCSPPCAPEGITTLRNAPIEPEIMDLIAILQKMGAIISVQTDRVITIEGVDRLGGFDHLAIPDRIEAGSWACAALATSGDIYVRGAQQLPMMTFLNVFRRIGGAFDVDDEGIRFWHPGGDAARHRARDRRAPGLHDRLAAAAGRRADPDHRTVDRARDGLREPARLHRRAARLGRARSRSTASASAGRRAASAAPTSCTRR